MKMKIGPWLTGDGCVDVRAEEIVHGYMFVFFSLDHHSHCINEEVEVGRARKNLSRVTQSRAQ